ncbi:MAG TPA: BsuPI-related putative proteinase inhibitor [Longimicrobiales bacterium]|nr:BsuPI-related putative proteinase inhibitor [Longimicrobiales bacterium]
MIAGLAAACAACAGGEEPAPAEAGGATTGDDASVEPPDDLATSLIARVGDGSIDFVLNVTNAGGEPIRLDFNSGQRFDVSVSDSAGNGVWHWSADKSFIQSLGSETLDPGATLAYEATWPDAPPGSYRALGEITASNVEIRHTVEIQVPAAED